MKMTLSELRAVIKSLKSDLDSKKGDLRNNTFSVEHLTSENQKIEITEKFDFEKALKEYEEMYDKYISYKAILQEANTKNMVDGVSLATLIIKSKYLRFLLKDIEDYAKRKTSKQRRDGYNNGNYYYECNVVNFDVLKMIEKRDSLRESLVKIDALIDKANTEIEINVK